MYNEEHLHSGIRLDGLTLDSGLHVSTVTNFEFPAPPRAAEPVYVFAYGDPLADSHASWSTDAPLSGKADLRLDFTFNREPGLYDEWVGIGIGCRSSDVSQHSTLVMWLSTDVSRVLRVRLDSTAYDEPFGAILSEFSVECAVGPEPRAFGIDLRDFYYPWWARGLWPPGTGFAGPDSGGARTRTATLHWRHLRARGPVQ